MTDTLDMILFECVKEGQKLKMKTQGHLINSNWQFPRDLRIEGCKYHVPVAYVKLMCSVSGKYFYSVKNKSVITAGTILNDTI